MIRKPSPSVIFFFFDEVDNNYLLYLGDYSTAEGLIALKPDIKVKLLTFGATLYQKYGYANERDIPDFSDVGEIISFFEKEGDLGLIDFEIELIGFGTLVSHDDSECTFTLKHKKEIVQLIRNTFSVELQNTVLTSIFKHPKMYLTYSDCGEVRKFGSFEKYLEYRATAQ